MTCKYFLINFCLANCTHRHLCFYCNLVQQKHPIWPNLKWNDAESVSLKKKVSNCNLIIDTTNEQTAIPLKLPAFSDLYHCRKIVSVLNFICHGSAEKLNWIKGREKKILKT